MGSGTAPGTVLTTTSYTGAGGTIAMNTFLAGDGSPSDKLVINGGTATGMTGLMIHNSGGPGAETFGNGIQVVSAINGGAHLYCNSNDDCVFNFVGSIARNTVS